MARSMFSLGMFSFLPAKIAVRKRGLEFASPPPMRAAMVISRMIRVKAWPRLASVAAFLCLMVAHFECPDMTHPRLFHVTAAWPGHRWKNFFAPQSGFGEGRPQHSRTPAEPMYGRQEKRHQCGDLR